MATALRFPLPGSVEVFRLDRDAAAAELQVVSRPTSPPFYDNVQSPSI